MELTPEEKERWIEHLKLFRNHSNRYNPNRSSDNKYIFLVQELERLGSISMVVKTHSVGRTTVHNAIRYVKKLNKETESPGGGHEDKSLPYGSYVSC